MFRYILIFIFLIFHLLVQADVSLSGVYQGKNIYVQNPFAGTPNEFCTLEVFVNGNKISTNLRSSAFEVDLSAHQINDKILINITHKEGCKPKILNPQAIRFNSSFNFKEVIAASEMLNWTTKGEKPNSKIIIEQFLNNSWVNSKEIKAKGITAPTNYDVPVYNHSGINKFRVKYIEPEGSVFYSQVAEFTSPLPPVDLYPKRASDFVYLTREAEYEILDAYGNSKLKGKGKEINVAKVNTGMYYVNTDNNTFKIFKK